MTLSSNEIKIMKKENFKLHINKKINDCAFNYLEVIKQRHTKVKHIVYEKLKIADYLVDPSIHINEKYMLFRLRTSMVNVKANFKSQYQDDLSCNLCHEIELQTQEHLLFCNTIHKNCPQSRDNIDIKHSYLFMEVEKQVRCVKLYKEVLEIKLKLEETDN